MTDGLNAGGSNDCAAPTDTNLKNLELVSPQSIRAISYFIAKIIIFRFSALTFLPEVRIEPQPTRVQDLSAVNVTSPSQVDRVNRNAYRYSAVSVMLVLFICK